MDVIFFGFGKSEKFSWLENINGLSIFDKATTCHFDGYTFFHQVKFYDEKELLLDGVIVINHLRVLVIVKEAILFYFNRFCF